MAIKDIKSQLVQSVTLSAVVGASATVNGLVIDNADNELGLMFAVRAAAYTAGTASVLLEESKTGAFAGEQNVVPSDKIIGSLSDVILSAAYAVGNVIPTVGVFANKRYVRASLVGDASAALLGEIIVTQKAEIVPV